MKRLTASVFSRFRTSERGAVLVEALITLPVITVFAVGVLEFGFIFYERQQLQVGVRDAARYLSRCSLEASFAAPCSQTIARNIAFYGTPTPSSTPRQRVRGWNSADELEISIVTNASTNREYLLRGRVDHLESPMFNLLGIDGVSIEYRYSMGYYGW